MDTYALSEIFQICDKSAVRRTKGVADISLNALFAFCSHWAGHEPDCVFMLNPKTPEPSKSLSILDNRPRMDADPAAQPLRVTKSVNALPVYAGTGMVGGRGPVEPRR
jgi:hypothetical protein